VALRLHGNDAVDANRSAMRHPIEATLVSALRILRSTVDD
jgi:hypothetical protein